MGAFFYMQYLWGAADASSRLGWLPLLSLIVFFIAYSGGYSNVPFIIMGELFPSRYRSILGSISSSFNLLCTFTVVRSFPPMQIGLGKYGAFWFFMCCTIAGLVFVYFFVPETKGKTLEDIEKLFSKKFNKDGTSVNQSTNDGRCNGLQIKFNSSLGTVETGNNKFDTTNGNKQENGNSFAIKPASFHPADSDDEEDNVVISGPVPTPI
jgi:facilitated trehalose transporter